MLHLLSMGHFVPENVIDNRFLQELGLDTDDAWILERVGIRERRTVLPLDYLRETKNRDVRAAAEAAVHSSADTGARAARMALERAGLSPSDVGLVIAGSSAPGSCSPPEACRIGEVLGIDAPAFDVHASCCTFGLHLHHVASLRPEAVPDVVLAVQVEHLTTVVDYTDRASAVLFGDAASAAVLSHRLPGRATVTDTSIASRPAQASAVSIPRLGYFGQDGRAVQNFAIRKMRSLVRQMADDAGLTLGSHFFIGHQANLLALEAVCRSAEVPEARHLHNVVVRGNTGSAGAATVLSEQWDRFAPGDDALVAIVGAGLSWSTARVRFGGGEA